ncbi:hypothetical protein Cgig2_000419 [Carnegiea gigantea]|uniref:Uncharacterized protein n=1 Tax=Carnegiea gigantea TaxID=171969 RepID=A0A9Q1GIY0_9CARY|nr:hypothetical protein Cgig2_000419 [Carnegiea gigantea]
MHPFDPQVVLQNEGYSRETLMEVVMILSMVMEFQILLKYPSITSRGGFAPRIEYRTADFQYSISGRTSSLSILAHFTPLIIEASTKVRKEPSSGLTRAAYELMVPRPGVVEGGGVVGTVPLPGSSQAWLYWQPLVFRPPQIEATPANLEGDVTKYLRQGFDAALWAILVAFACAEVMHKINISLNPTTNTFASRK